MNQVTDLLRGVAVPLACLLGAATATGLMLLCAGARPRPRPTSNGDVPRGRCRGLLDRIPRVWRGPRLAGAVVAGVVAGALTGWPVAGLLVACGVVTLPGLLGPDRPAAAEVERMEAVATWTEMLRDTLSAAAGLEQALLATAPLVPPPVRPQMLALAGRIKTGQPLPQVLEAFAREVADPAADTVVTVLVIASRRQAAQLGPLLGSLAAAVREQVAMRQRIAASRASMRTSVRVCCTTTLVLAGGLVVFNRPYLQPFNSPAGQLALAVVGGLFACSFAWLNALATIRQAPRLLAPTGVARGVGER